MLAYWCYCILAPFFSLPVFPLLGKGMKVVVVLLFCDGFFCFKFFSWNSLVTCEEKKKYGRRMFTLNSEILCVVDFFCFVFKSEHCFILKFRQ